MRDERRHKLLIRLLIAPEGLGSFWDGAVENGCAVLKRMRQRHVRLNPVQAIFLERQGAKKRRSEPEWVNGGADIVNKPREGQLGRTSAAADGWVRFENENGKFLLREADGCGEAVGAGTNHDRIVGNPARHSAFSKP